MVILMLSMKGGDKDGLWWVPPLPLMETGEA